jgi:epoxyqueuosine reductase
MYTVEEYGMDELPGRSGVYNRFQCNRQMDIDIANAEAIDLKGRAALGKKVKYCRECEMACPAGTAA